MVMTTATTLKAINLPVRINGHNSITALVKAVGGVT